MTGGLIGIVVGILLIVIISISGQRRHHKPKKPTVKRDDIAVWPFDPMPIMTDSEVLFFAKLTKAIPEYYIFSQVQLSRVIEVAADSDDKQFWLNRISRQSIDYIVVDTDAQTTLLAIELDDWTHDSVTRKRTDEKKDKALASAGIPILRYHAEKMPSVTIIKNDVHNVIEKYWS